MSTEVFSAPFRFRVLLNDDSIVKYDFHRIRAPSSGVLVVANKQGDVIALYAANVWRVLERVNDQNQTEGEML